MKLESSTTSKSTDIITLTGKDILHLLLEGRHIAKRNFKSVEVVVQVPGGGDWSNTKLDLDSDSDVKVILKYEN